MYATNKMQQIPFIDLFRIGSICFGRQIRPSSGAHFECIYSFGSMHQYCCRPASPVGSNINALNQSCVYSQKKCSWRWVSLSPETYRADSDRSIKRSLNRNCCILLFAYIVVLMTHGLTNIMLFLNLSYSGGVTKSNENSCLCADYLHWTDDCVAVSSK